MTYRDDEFAKMLKDVESDLVERKESFRGDAPTKAREAVCSFANDLPDYRRPGVVFIGALDNGEPSRVAITDELLRQLADMKTDGSITPPPTLTVAREARKPMFFLKPADGALGGHARAVEQCYKDFRVLAERIAARCGIAIP